MAFGKKKDSVSLEEAKEALEDPRKLRELSKQQIKDLQRRVAGKTNIVSDIRAAHQDHKSGRKLGGVGDPPPVRKGRSMWGKDTPLK